MSTYALTKHSDKIENAIISPIYVAKPSLDSSMQDYSTLAIWDTGATNSVITESMAKEIGLTPVTMTPISGVHGTKVANVYFVHVTLNNREISLDLKVTECAELSPDRSIGMLIGMDVITRGDFSITNYGGRTCMTFRVPSLETTDYVSEIKEFNRCQKVHDINTAKHLPDKCACGSGREYKNCHGKSPYNK